MHHPHTYSTVTLQLGLGNAINDGDTTMDDGKSDGVHGELMRLRAEIDPSDRGRQRWGEKVTKIEVE